MKILVSGYGQMGRMLVKKIDEGEAFDLVGVVDALGQGTVTTFAEVKEIPDVVIDFSHPKSLKGILSFALTHHVPVVLATTNYSEADERAIQEASKQIPIFKTANLSFGIQALLKAIKTLQELLPEADIEIVETHHRRKVDAPSGTAHMLVNALNDSHQSVVYGRKGEQKRTANEIGVHSLRGGTVNGIHEVNFLLDDEVISIKHQAENKWVFVKGALKAATFVVKQTRGLYEMKDILEE